MQSIKTNGKSPVELKSYINQRALEDDSEMLAVQTQDVFNLRRGRTLVKNVKPETKYETITFKHFLPKLLNTFKHFDFLSEKTLLRRK